MSVVQTIMETIAKVLPDQEVDPLIAHTDYVGQALQRVDGHAKVLGERVSRPNSNSITWPMRRWCTAPSQKGKSARSTPKPPSRRLGCSP